MCYRCYVTLFNPRYRWLLYQSFQLAFRTLTYLIRLHYALLSHMNFCLGPRHSLFRFLFYHICLLINDLFLRRFFLDNLLMYFLWYWCFPEHSSPVWYIVGWLLYILLVDDLNWSFNSVSSEWWIASASILSFSVIAIKYCLGLALAQLLLDMLRWFQFDVGLFFKTLKMIVSFLWLLNFLSKSIEILSLSFIQHLLDNLKRSLIFILCFHLSNWSLLFWLLLWLIKFVSWTTKCNFNNSLINSVC